MLAGVLGVRRDFLEGAFLEQRQQPLARAQQAFLVALLDLVVAAAGQDLSAAFPQNFQLFLGEHEPYLVAFVLDGKLTIKPFPLARVRSTRCRS